MLNEDQFLKEAIDKFKEEMKKRINEIPTVTQWIDLATKRRIDEIFDGVSEKEFLLCHATSIKKCQPFLTLTNDSVIELIY